MASSRSADVLGTQPTSGVGLPIANGDVTLRTVATEAAIVAGARVVSVAGARDLHTLEQR